MRLDSGREQSALRRLAWPGPGRRRIPRSTVQAGSNTAP